MKQVVLIKDWERFLAELSDEETAVVVLVGGRLLRYGEPIDKRNKDLIQCRLAGAKVRYPNGLIKEVNK